MSIFPASVVEVFYFFFNSVVSQFSFESVALYLRFINVANFSNFWKTLRFPTSNVTLLP